MDENRDNPDAKQANDLPHETVLDLKATREARGLSLNDIFLATRISMLNLIAVENYDFDRLPPPVYSRNFIRKYAAAVGIDEKPIMARYAKHIEGLKPPHEEPEVQKPWPETGQRNLFLFGSLAALIAAGIIVYAIFLYNQSGGPIAPTQTEGLEPSAQKQPAAPVEPPSSPKTKPVSIPQQLALPAAPLLPPQAANISGQRLHLVIEAREPTWIRIKEDLNPPYQTLLNQGDRIERMASDHFQLDIGNAGGIDLIFQGKSVENLGKRGQIVHLRLPEKSIERESP
jgi:cytoskeleton protein RodZ